MSGGLFLALLAGLLLVVASAVALLVVSARRERDDRQRRLRDASPDELAEDVRIILEIAGWGRHRAGAALLARDAGWSDEALKERLDELRVQCLKEDADLGQGDSRAGNAFQLHDTGLTAISEELDRRMGAPRTAYRD